MPKIVNKDEKIKQIVFASMPFFAEKGFTATNVAEIAKAAGIGKGTIYEYFNKKEDLFIAALREFHEEGIKELIDMLEGVKDPEKKLLKISEKSILWYSSVAPTIPKLLLEVMKQSVMKHGIFFKKRHVLEELHFQFHLIIKNILLEGISNGIFDPSVAKDVEKIAFNLNSYLEGIGMKVLFTGMDEEFHKEHVDYYMHNLIDSLKKS